MPDADGDSDEETLSLPPGTVVEAKEAVSVVLNDADGIFHQRIRVEVFRTPQDDADDASTPRWVAPPGFNSASVGTSGWVSVVDPDGTVVMHDSRDDKGTMFAFRGRHGEGARLVQCLAEQSVGGRTTREWVVAVKYGDDRSCSVLNTGTHVDNKDIMEEWEPSEFADSFFVEEEAEPLAGGVI